MVDPSGRSIHFVATAAGPHAVRVVGSVSNVICDGDAVTFAVVDASAPSVRYRLRYAPLADQPAPPQEDPAALIVSGSADVVLPARTLDPGFVVTGALTGPGGAPVGAYLHLTPADGGAGLVLVAGPNGAYAGRLPSGRFDVVVVPYDGALAPLRRVDQTAEALDQGYVLDAGATLSGVIRAGDSSPVAGARVRVAAGTLPATVATTEPDGSFSARFRPSAGPLVLEVVPPPGSGLPELRLDAAAGVTLVGGESVEVTYAIVPTVVLAATASDAAGAPLPGARLTFVARSVAAGGALSVDGGAATALAPAIRAQAVADGTGALAVLLPEGEYDVVVEPPAGASGQGLGRASLDLRGGAPASPPVFSTSALADFRVTVLTPGGAVVEGARVGASSRGIHGVGVGVASVAMTNTMGAATLRLAPGVVYDVRIEPPRAVPGVARAFGAAMATGPTGQGMTFKLPAAVEVAGELLFSTGVGQPGVHVQASCDVCPAGLVSGSVVAETTTGAGGRFLLRLPSPP